MLVHRERTGLLGRLVVGGLLVASSVFVSGAAAATSRVICSTPDSTSSTGRQYAMVTVSPRDPHYCMREKLGGEAPPGVPDCWRAIREAELTCDYLRGID